jgi:hypothetical protein
VELMLRRIQPGVVRHVLPHAAATAPSLVRLGVLELNGYEMEGCSFQFHTNMSSQQLELLADDVRALVGWL